MLNAGQKRRCGLDSELMVLSATMMDRTIRATAIDTAARKLRSACLESAIGEMIGSEETLLTKLGCSRATLKQVARLLEREGLLKVRRGSNGGYFAARPDAGTIEAIVSAHLEALDVDPDDATIMASALWVGVMRKAADADNIERAAVVDRLKRRLEALRDDAAFDSVLKIEQIFQAEIFTLAKSRYIQVMFNINTEFYRRNFEGLRTVETMDDDVAFVRRWRSAKQVELSALSLADVELAGSAGRTSREVWHDRIRRRLLKSGLNAGVGVDCCTCTN